MLKEMSKKLLIIKLIPISFLVLLLFSACSGKRLYSVSISSDSGIIFDLLTKNCQSHNKETFKFTENQLLSLEKDVKNVLDILGCNFQNYIYKSNHNYFIIKINDDEIKIEESDDFRYVYNPNDFNAIQEGEYKGYVKEPYLDIPSEMSQYASILSFYKSLCIYLNTIDKKYFQDYFMYEYMLEYYISKI